MTKNAMQANLFDRLSKSMGNQIHSQTSGMGFVELLDQSSRVSVRLSNAVRAAAAEGKLPYPTIGAYLEAGILGRFRMSRLPNIGRKSIAELELLISEASQYQAMLVEQSDNSHSRNGQTDGRSRSASSPLAEASFVELLSKFCGVNTSLLGAIQAASSTNALPFRTISDYVDAGELGKSKMLQVDGLDAELLVELDHILAVCGFVSPMATETLNTSSELSTNCEDGLRDNVLDLTLDAFLARQTNVSTRLLNAISTATSIGACPFNTVADYLRCNSRQAELQKVENLGRGSAIEFERLITRSLRAKTTQAIRQNDQGFIDVCSILGEGLSLLTSRQQEVLIGRLQEKKTLEAVAATRGVTRERIRQIEARSLRALSTNFASVLRDSASIVCSQLCTAEKFEVSLEEFSKLVSCEVGQSTLYLALLKRFDIDQSTLGLSEGNVFVRAHYAPRETWKAALAEEIKNQPLPLVLDSVLASIDSVPTFYVRDHFQRKWGSECCAPESAVPRYGTTRMCIDALRTAGRPLHTSEVRARIYAKFQIDIQEHAINATLGRNEEVVIAAPGTYALYESLPFSAAQIQSIRNIAHKHLIEKGVFLSSKILFEQAFAARSDEYSGALSHYLVMGIVQDDQRFITKRGNMVGLTTFDLTETYTPLHEEIRRIVLEHGPITLPEITERLSDTRKLCNDSGIRLVLAQSPDIIRTGQRTFVSLHRFFETRGAYDDLLLALRISLLERKKTTFAITQDLSRLQVQNLTPHLVESLLLSMDDVASHGEIHELVSATDELAEYNEAIVRAQTAGGRADLKAVLCGSIPKGRLTKLMSLDARLLIDSGSSDAECDNPELASILGEFSF